MNPDGEFATRPERGAPGDASGSTRVSDSPGVRIGIPWDTKTAPDRVRPRECVREARDALDRAYGITDRAAVPVLIEAVDWLRRALEQMTEDESGS